MSWQQSNDALLKNMKRFSEQFYKQAQQCTLTPSERTDIRDRLVSYIEYHPLPASVNAAEATTVRTHAGNEVFYSYHLPWSVIFRGAIGFSVLFLVIVPILAERAVPGDTLYAVKVGLTEEVRSTLTFTPSQRVVWETTRLNRRIAEAQLLESKGELTEAVEADVAAAVKAYTDNAQREIAHLRAVDTDEAALVELELATTLSVHSDALRNRTMVSQSNNASTTEMTNMILSALTEAQMVGKDASASTTVPSYEKLVARVEQHTTRLYEVLAALEQTSSPEELREASRRVNDIERAIAATFVLSETDTPAAQAALMAILQRSQRLLVYLTNLEVRAQVTLESIAPIDLTPEEQVTKINALRSTLREMVVTLEAASATTSPQSDKVAFARDQIREIEATIASTTAGYDEMRTIHALESAISIAEAAQGLLDRFEVSAPKEEVVGDNSEVMTATTTESALEVEAVISGTDSEELTSSSTDSEPEDLTPDAE